MAYLFVRDIKPETLARLRQLALDLGEINHPMPYRDLIPLLIKSFQMQKITATEQDR